MLKNQIIKLKPADLNKAIIRGLSRSAWETKKVQTTKEQIHSNPKLKNSRYKKRSVNLDEEF